MTLKELKSSLALRAIVPLNTLTVVLIILKALDLIEITWLQAFSPAMTIAIILGLMAEYGARLMKKEHASYLRRMK